VRDEEGCGRTAWGSKRQRRHGAGGGMVEQGGGSRRAAGGVEKRATERVRGEGEEEARSAGTLGYVGNWAGAVLQTNPSVIFS
jgi:hypothetical protein